MTMTIITETPVSIPLDPRPLPIVETETAYLAIIFIGGGSSWGQADTAFEAIKLAKQGCERDWGSLFTFSKTTPARVNVFNITGVEGWYADDTGVRDIDTKALVPHLFTCTAWLKNKRR